MENQAERSDEVLAGPFAVDDSLDRSASAAKFNVRRVRVDRRPHTVPSILQGLAVNITANGDFKDLHAIPQARSQAKSSLLRQNRAHKSFVSGGRYRI
jgi:hypothetical protein